MARKSKEDAPTKYSYNLCGFEFGSFTVTKKVAEMEWLCTCSKCGAEVIFAAYIIRTGKAPFCCNCIKQRYNNTSKEYKRTPIYLIWQSMNYRCNSPKHKAYKDYGGCGITVCREWKNSFEQFVKDMGDRPTPKHRLKRIDKTKGFFKDNCEWVTHQEISNNRRNNIILTHNGKSKTISEWSDELKLPYEKIYYYYNKVSDKRKVIEIVLQKEACKKELVLLTHEGKSQTILKWAAELNISHLRFYYYVNKNIPKDKIIELIITKQKKHERN